MSVAFPAIDSLAVGVYGHLPSVAAVGDADCYSVFHGLSSALGLLSDAEPALWGMNDVAGPWSGPDEAALCGWFQVGPASDAIRPVPLTALVATATATLERFGAVALAGLDLYLPLAHGGSAYSSLLDSRAWFAPVDPADRVQVRVTVDAAPERGLASRMDALLGALRTFATDPERGDHREVSFATPVPWRWWLGDTTTTTTLLVTAPEWTPLALGHTAAIVAEACRAAGLSGATGLRLARA